MKVSKSGLRGRAGAPRDEGGGVIGSPFATHANHGGRIAGAGMVKTGEPGRFGNSVRTHVGDAMTRGAPSGAVPRGMKTYSQE